MIVAHRLRIKYGLERIPNDDEVSDWARETQELIRQGLPSERAGELASSRILPGHRSHIFKAEADNIEALLRELAKK